MAVEHGRLKKIFHMYIYIFPRMLIRLFDSFTESDKKGSYIYAFGLCTCVLALGSMNLVLYRSYVTCIRRRDSLLICYMKNETLC